ncbi:hypothetical protein B7494_g7725 [Chlorociboria aeruginascens]|nr:hypothetical protein B7494_g7725 [Chlorociboria aeruginascens]
MSSYGGSYDQQQTMRGGNNYPRQHSPGLVERSSYAALRLVGGMIKRSGGFIKFAGRGIENRGGGSQKRRYGQGMGMHSQGGGSMSRFAGGDGSVASGLGRGGGSSYGEEDDEY